MKLARKTGPRQRAFLIAALASAAVLAPATAAFANASSATGYYGPINGHSYYNRADLINSNPSFVIGSTVVGKQGSGSVPSGYMGATARLFNGGGSLVAESGYAFTTGAGSSFSRGVHYGGHGAFYSYGVSAAFNGGGNSYYYTLVSPTQNW